MFKQLMEVLEKEREDNLQYHFINIEEIIIVDDKRTKKHITIKGINVLTYRVGVDVIYNNNAYEKILQAAFDSMNCQVWFEDDHRAYQIH